MLSRKNSTHIHSTNRLGMALRATLAAGTAAIALTALPALAQDDEGAGASEGDVIVVTARRREESILDVPIAVTALGADDLADLQASDLSGVQGAVPNVNIVQGRGSATSANFFIRGIGQPDALQTFDPAVGVYVDGVYMSRIQGALLNLFDVARVEVLRGPQGTLYGKNTIGGAVNIVSRKPDFLDTHYEGSFSYGRFDEITAKGYVSTPLGDNMAFSLAGLWDERDGIVTDPLTGQRYNDRDNLSFRGILRADPAPGVELSLSGDYTRQRNALTLGQATTPLFQTDFGLGAVLLPPAVSDSPYRYRASTSFSNGEGQKLDHWGVAMTANIDLSDSLELVSITSYRDLEPEFFIDIDATEYELGDVFVGIDQRQWSQELQLKYSGDRLNGVLGLYYLDEKVESHQEAYADDLFAFNGFPISFTRLIDDAQRTRSFAAFGQATYDFSDRFSVTGGLRYTREKKSYNRFTTTISDLALLNGIDFLFPGSLPAPLNSDDDAVFDAWTPSVTLSFKPDANKLIYASASRGFKSGGFNGRANSLSDLTLIVNGTSQLVTRFEPETVWTYELGAKGSFLDGAVRLSAAAFYSDYKDFQARVGGGVAGSAGAGVFPVLNAGKLRITGFEFEATVKPSDPLTLSAAVGYLDADYKEFNDGRRVPPQSFSCNPTGTRIVCQPAFAPPLTLRLGGDYRIPLGDSASLSLGGDLRFVDKQFLSVDNRPGLTENGYWLGNVYAQLDLMDGRYYLRGAIKNVGDTLYRTDGQEFSSVGNIQTVYYGDPRTWTLTAGFKF
ncbi:MAG: TonB-dependent receptor [Blastomonas sp.]